jgi:glyoxalase family protein
MLQLTGIHHLTAVTADASGNHAFYTRVLGLRLVKKTVNQDDVSAYHLFYADGRGSPGTDITFFDWPAAPARRGSSSICRTALRVATADDLAWWHEHLTRQGVKPGPVHQHTGRAAFDFEDPEGQRLQLVADGGASETHVWTRGPIPAERQIRGLGPISLSVPALAPTAAVLTHALGLRLERGYRAEGETGPEAHVFAMGPGGAAAELHLIIEPDLPPARPGAGGVHHVALRCPDNDYEAWSARLGERGLRHSGPVNRFYFRSLYFREPQGILFEIATDGPGFDADEPLDTLGERLALPPFLEPRRADIEAGLKPLDTSG